MMISGGDDNNYDDDDDDGISLDDISEVAAPGRDA